MSLGKLSKSKVQGLEASRKAAAGLETTYARAAREVRLVVAGPAGLGPRAQQARTAGRTRDGATPAIAQAQAGPDPREPRGPCPDDREHHGA